jgi:predicted AlkP superfamily phosphohydrolase/phosphomutase
VYMLDWGGTKAYAPTPSGNGIHIVRAGRGAENGVPEAEYERFRTMLAEKLAGFTDPTTGKPVVSRVWTREEVFDGPHIELSPDLTLELRDGGLVSILASNDPYKPRSEPSGTHRMEGFFSARGPGLRQGVRLPALSILDVAPLLLYSLGLSIPADLEGQVPTDAWEPGLLQARPVETVSPSGPAADAPSEIPVGPALDEEAEAELMRRLRALGYVE